MGDNFKKVQPGDKFRIPAATYNAFIDAAIDLRARRQNVTSQDTPTFRQSGIILVKNNSGADRDRFDVLGVADPIFLPTENEDSFKNRVMFDGVTPVAPTHKAKFVILLEPLKAGAIGMACIDGVCPAWVKRPSGGESHKYADIIGGDATALLVGDLENGGGAQILWLDPTIPPGGSGWAVVRLLAWQSTDSLVVARVDAKADCGGCYLGTIMTGKTSIDPSAGTTEAMPYGLAAGATCYIVNTDENGQDTHLLKVDGTAYVIGKLTGMTTGTLDPMQVVITESTIGATDSPETIDGTSSTYNFDTKNWSRYHKTAGDDLGGVPFQLKNTGRQFWKDAAASDTDNAGTTSVKGFSRTLTVDAAGRWWKVSAESTSEIYKIPTFDLTTAPVFFDHVKHTNIWAFDNSDGVKKWVKLKADELDVVTGLSYSNGDHILHMKKRTLRGFFDYSPESDTAVLTAQSIQVDVDQQVLSATGVYTLQQKKHSLWVFEAVNDAGWSTWATINAPPSPTFTTGTALTGVTVTCNSDGTISVTGTTTPVLVSSP